MTTTDEPPRAFADHVLQTFADLNADILVAHILATQALKAVVRSSRRRGELFEEIRGNVRRAIEQAPIPDDPAYEGMRQRTVERALARLDTIFDEMGREAALEPN